MAKGFKHGSGGGSELNFRVVASLTEPQAREGDIWVPTEDRTGWRFRADAPQPREGLVWIRVGTASPVAFGALKKEALWVYPLGAKQYREGAWVTVAARSRQGGSWVEWIGPGTLFDGGIWDASLTDGWSGYPYRITTTYSGAEARVTVGELLEAELTLTAKNQCAFVAAPVDLTEWSAVSLSFREAFSSPTGSSTVALKVCDTAGNIVASGGAALAAGEVFTDTVRVDVSGLNGTYLVGFMLWAQAVGTSITAKLAQARLE